MECCQAIDVLSSFGIALITPKKKIKTRHMYCYVSLPEKTDRFAGLYSIFPQKGL